MDVFPVDFTRRHSFAFGGFFNAKIQLARDYLQPYSIMRVMFSKKKLMRRAGFFLIGLGLMGFFLWISPIVVLEARYRLGWFEDQPVPTPVSAPAEERSGFGLLLEKMEAETGFGGILRRGNIEIFEPENPRFSVLIPKIGVNSFVVADVPVDDEDAYRKALKIGVAHARGTYLPDEEKTTLIFGHSTDSIWTVAHYNALFYLLGKLEPGDEISLFYETDKYDYKVVKTEVVKTDELAVINGDLERNQLILMTCWPPGTTWKRLLVWAEPV